MLEPNKYFLGWDKPFLSTAAKWLLEHCLQVELGTSDRLLILVSGQAISKRLQSIFIHEANKVGRAVELPKILTPSQLFRNFIEMQGRIADPTTTLLATVAILKSMDPHIIAPIVGPRRPREKDFTAWLRIARHVCDAMSTAAGNGYSIDQSEWPASAKAILTESAIKRFDLLKEIQNNLWESLHKQGLSIFEYEQLALLQDSKQLDLGLVERLVVVGAPDLAGIATQLLSRMLEQDVTIDILIRAPESESLGFDAYGCIDTSCWINREIEINDAAITVSGSPSAQAAAVIRKLEQLGDSVTTDQITISSTDESLIPIIRRHIEGYGINTRFAGGDSVLQKQEAILLSCLATFVSTRSYDSYASLVRHPDIADLLKIEDSVVKKLSKYSMTVIPKQVSHDEWFSPKESREDFSGLQELHKAIFNLLGPCFKQEENPALIEQSSKVIRAFLLTVYGDESLNIDDPRFKVLQKIFSLIDRLDDLTETISKQLGPLSFSEVLSIVLEELSGMSVPALASIEAIDIVGWLEAIATESPHLIVVGMSADLIGGNDPSDSFFPDGLREALGLETINRRMARDAHAIIAMQHAHSSNGSIDWIVGRKNMDGDPLNASPLLMRCSDSEQLAKRSGELVISMERENPEVPPQFKRLSEGSGLAFPNPKEFQLEKVRKLSVTAFKDFIACPYRFWLKHILKLNLAEEGSSELDAKLFGTFVHAVLQRFGENTSVRNSTDVKEIETLLLAELDQLAKEQLGAGISGKVRVQLELAKYRLRLFAAHQAESSAEGWKIVCTERKANTVLEVGGSPFKISGIIDRIDVHEDGRIRVLDYKTGATSANNMHFKKTSGLWIDYQLPLYRRLLSEIKELDNYDTTNNNISLGYFKISDQESTSGVDLLALPEAAMESVDDQIEMTITSILKGEFTERPTEPAPKYSDTFSWICQDNSVTEQSYND